MKHICLVVTGFVLSGLLPLSCNLFSTPDQAARDNWAYPGGDAGQRKYSALHQITKENVKYLKEAWTYHSGEKSGGVESTPLVVGGRMYITTPSQQLISLDAATGKELWRFNPARGVEKFAGVNRGIAYHKLGTRELVFYTTGNFLNAVDAESGRADSSFGQGGRIILNEALDGQTNTAPAAPVFFKDIVIVGVAGGRGHVKAYDAHSGKIKWVFNTIPHPGEYGYSTWGDSTYWKTGSGADVWGGLCVDENNGIVYFSTGQPRPNFYRRDNKGAQLYGNCLIAVDGSTGKRIWHYQVIHHDLWDLDLPCPPILVELKIGGDKIPGVMQLSKTGNIFLFNRLTGKLLSKVEERPVPPSTLPGEVAFPTQPYVTWPAPFSRQVVTQEDLTRRTPEAHAYAKSIFDQAETGWFVPPSEKGILYYGIHGGAEWFGGAYDPDANMLYVTANELAWHIKMNNINAAAGNQAPRLSSGHTIYLKMGCVNCHGADRKGQTGIPDLNSLASKYTAKDIAGIIHKGRQTMPAFPQIKGDELKQLTDFLLNVKGKDSQSAKDVTPEYRSWGYVKFLDKEGYPATKPPWGTLNAVDLTTGEIKWKVPLGNYQALTDAGIPQTGTENFGGCIVTKGGLVFVGATRDIQFRAFDVKTGKELWSAKLPYGGFATPSTYEVKGKQYVIIAATGGGKMGPPTGDAYVAFALPEK